MYNNSSANFIKKIKKVQNDCIFQIEYICKIREITLTDQFCDVVYEFFLFEKLWFYGLYNYETILKAAIEFGLVRKVIIEFNTQYLQAHPILGYHLKLYG